MTKVTEDIFMCAVSKYLQGQQFYSSKVTDHISPTYAANFCWMRKINDTILNLQGKNHSTVS